MRSAPARPVRACIVRSCCNVVVQEQNLRASPVQCNVKQTLSFTMKQPFQCNLQPEIHAPASSPTHAPCNIHAAITMRCASTHCRTPKGGTDYARNDRSRTRRAHKLPLLQPLYTAKRFLPNTSPMQHSCSHYNAFCSTLHTSMRCRTPRKNRLLETIPAAPAAHTKK